MINNLFAPLAMRDRAKGIFSMSPNELPEKRTVARTDELLRKSRRLIDELEFILEKLPKELRDNEDTQPEAAGEELDAQRSEDRS
jgi:hypothetical protein